MKISTKQPATENYRRRRLRSASRWMLSLICLGITFLIGAYLGVSGKLDSTWGNMQEKLAIIRTQNVHLLEKAASGVLAEPKRLIINIKFANYQKLVEQRKRAIAVGVLTVTDEDYVSATVEHAGTSIPVQIRLKGDLSDHFSDHDKWSFRVRTRGENTLFGMKQFSLHHPNTRNYVYEWLYHQALLREEVIGLRYDFIRVTLNGRDLGVYALEEHFEKRLVENNRRREGPIVRFSEERLWEEWKYQKIPFSGARQNGAGSFLASEVDAFQTTKWQQNDELKQLHEKAVGLLRSFQRGDLAAGDVFDIEKMARYLAVTDLMGAEHGARWHNTRFYYNPVMSKMEPIGFDGDAGKPISFLCIHMKDRHWSENAWSADPTYFAALFRDERLVDRYLLELERISHTSYLKKLLEELDTELQRHLRIVYSEDPSFEYSPEPLYRNQRYIRSVLEPVSPITAHVHLTSSETLELRLGNLQALPIEVLRCRYQQSPEASLDLPSGPIRLPGREPTELVTYQQVRLGLPDGPTWDEKALSQHRVEYRVPGAGTTGDVGLTSWPFASADDLMADITRRSPNATAFEFVELDEVDKIIRIKAGDYRIAEDLIFPPDYIVRCGPDTRLHLTNGAMILSRSPVEFLGSSEAPIKIDSPDGTGQGFVILTAERTSTLEYVVFQGLVSPSRSGWSLTGAVTFYESPVRLSCCQFIDNRAEDSLNTIRTTCLVEECIFSGCPSDAFDADFCRGEISKSTFQNCVNDGIDVSGSQFKITGNRINYMGDKGISIGERSLVEASNITIDQAKIGVAVKDLSVLHGDHLQVRSAQIGVALYRKKPEFGPASAELRDLRLEDVQQDFSVEQQSSLMIDGRSIAPNAIHLARQLEPPEENAPTP